MRKQMSLLLCLLLAVSMLVGLTGCSSDKDALIGTWNGEADLTDVINESFAADEELSRYVQVDSFKLPMVLVFNQDGTYSLGVDKTAVQAEIESLKTDVSDGLTAYLEDVIKEQGLTGVTVDDLLSAMGVSMEDLMAEAFSEDAVDELVEEMASEGNFDVKDGKLFLSDGLDYAVDETVYETYTLEGSTLTLLEYVADDATEEDQALYPMVFTKK